MKTTYLFTDKSANGETRLVIGTLAQYKAITIANAQLPMDQRRHFIVDRIPESEGLDVMYIEVDYEHFLGWARQYMAAYRNRQDAKHFTVLSLDAPNPIDEALTMHDCIASSVNVEQEAIGNAEIDAFRKVLRDWKPWGAELLDAYLFDAKRTCTKDLAEKCHVSERTIQRSKTTFERMVKKYFE